MKLDDWLSNRKVIITCGTGGVGKTTLSAALALRAAAHGRKVAVVTIDPAKRLATSLGISGIGDAPHELTSELREALRKKNRSCDGRFWAVMPDTRRTFESFVHRMAPNAGIAEKVFANPIFQIFAKEFSGTNEYMAMERLFSLWKSNQYDLIILDTPPSQNALSFLEAPRLLSQFFDDRIIKWFILPANKLVAAGMKKAFSVLERLTGSGFMTHLFEFAEALFLVRANFQSNLSQVTDLLKSKQVGFLLVSGATPDTVPDAKHFVESVQSHDFHFDGWAVNRTLGQWKIGLEEKAKALKAPGMVEAFELLSALQAREKVALSELESALPASKLHISLSMPELARDVHSIDDLTEVALSLEERGENR